MEQQLKHRLIGVTIIVSLIVIFVPLLFDKAEQHPGMEANGVPPMPDVFEEKPIDLPKTAEDVAPKESEVVSESGYKVIPLTDEPPKPPVASPEAKSAAIASEPGEALLEAPIEEEQFEPVPERAPSPTEMPDAKAVKPGSNQVKQEKAELKGKEPKKVKTPVVPSPATKSKTSTPVATKSAETAPKAADATATMTKNQAASVAKSAPVGATAGSKAGTAPAAVPAAWVVQTGSFTTESKARALAEKLRQAKFAAFVATASGKTGPIYRVQVGPELERTRVEQIQKQIETTVGIRGIIVPHR